MHLVVMKADFLFLPGFLNFLRQNLGIMGVCYIYKGKEGIKFSFLSSPVKMLFVDMALKSEKSMVVSPGV